VQVVFAITGALTMTPALLLSFPDFFTAERRLGLSADGVACLARAVPRNSATAKLHDAVDPELAGDGHEPLQIGSVLKSECMLFICNLYLWVNP